MKIYVYSTSNIDIDFVNDNMYCLSKRRQERIVAARNPKDKLLRFAGGMALKQAMEESGIDEANIQYQEGKKGKPRLDDDNRNLHFNISHSGEYGVAVLSDEVVGIDIEKIRPHSDSIVERCLTENEKLYLKEDVLNDPPNKMSFIKIWTLKESFLKMTGRGIIMEMNKLETKILNRLEDNKELNDESLTLDSPLHTAKAVIRDLNDESVGYANIIEDIEGYILSVCTPKPIEELEIIYIN